MNRPDTAEKHVQSSISVDSISGEVSDTEIQESGAKNSATNIKSGTQNKSGSIENDKETVSIAVNVSKVLDPSKPSAENNGETENKRNLMKAQQTTNTDKESGVLSSKVMLNGSFFEKLEEVKNIINIILEQTFERVEHKEPVTSEQGINSIHSSGSLNERDGNLNNRSGTSNEKSSFNKEDSNKLPSKISLKQINENKASSEVFVGAFNIS